MKFLTFGEIMLRLKAPGQECFFQSPMLEATFGGGEANVAVSLANYGEDAAFLTVLPDNAIADACKAELRRFDVDTKRIVTGEGRMGIYYLEGGANQRPSKVVYDRAYSAIALAKPGDIDWDKAFDGVEWFHITGITHAIDEMELSSWFTGEFDHGSAILSIKPGQGGLEAQDWTFMLFKMYMKYCARRGWKVTVNDCPAAEVIGIDRATITVEGKDAFGMLRAEAGVHRLVRISPTDAKKRRQTTFAGVEVIPVLPDDIQIEVAPDDIRVDVYHASGPGGQGVNTTDSAVRVTHIPTGIVVTCQNERSQIQNKAACMQILKARLYELELERRGEMLDEIRGPKTDIGFGNQIRSYVLYPYQMVKDLRTGYETSQTQAVFDGDINAFIEAGIRWRHEQRRAAETEE